MIVTQLSYTAFDPYLVAHVVNYCRSIVHVANISKPKYTQLSSSPTRPRSPPTIILQSHHDLLTQVRDHPPIKTALLPLEKEKIDCAFV